MIQNSEFVLTSGFYLLNSRFRQSLRSYFNWFIFGLYIANYKQKKVFNDNWRLPISLRRRFLSRREIASKNRAKKIFTYRSPREGGRRSAVYLFRKLVADPRHVHDALGNRSSLLDPRVNLWSETRMRRALDTGALPRGVRGDLLVVVLVVAAFVRRSRDRSRRYNCRLVARDRSFDLIREPVKYWLTTIRKRVMSPCLDVLCPLLLTPYWSTDGAPRDVPHFFIVRITCVAKLCDDVPPMELVNFTAAVFFGDDRNKRLRGAFTNKKCIFIYLFTDQTK